MRRHARNALAKQRRAGARVVRRQPAEREGRLVGRHRHAVEFNRALHRRQADGHQPALPRVAHGQHIGGDGVAQKILGQALRVKRLHAVVAGGKAQLGQQQFGFQIGVGVLQRFGHRRFVHIGQDARATVAHGRQRLGLRRDDGVAGEDGVGLLRVDAHLVQALGHIGQAHKAHHRPAFLRKAHEVEHARALAFQVRGHGDDGAHRDHAGAPYARDQQVVRPRPGVGRRHGHAGHQSREGVLPARPGARQRTRLLAQLAATHADEAGAKALGTRIVFVAGGLVDLALAAQRRFVRQHGHAIALHAAIAAAFAHGFVDEQALGGVGHLALLAAAALFGGAGLLVDQHRDAVHFAQLALHAIQFGAVKEARVGGKLGPHSVVLADVVRQHHHLLDAFALHLARNGIHADHAIDRLAARHGHGVVEQNLVGDACLGRHRLANGQIARVVVGAVAQVLKHMRHLGEARVRHPIHALAAHLDQARRVAVHPVGHEVAADAGTRRRAFGHHGGGVVRTAGAEVRHALDAVGIVAEQLRQREVAHVRAAVGKAAGKVADQPVGRQLDQARGAQLAQRRDQRRALGVLLAQNGGAQSVGRVVEQLAQLRLDHRAFFLDDQDFLQPLRKRQRARGLHRKRQADLVQAHTRFGQHGGRDLQAPQHFHQVVVRLAAGDDAHRGVRRFDDVAVDGIHRRKRRHRLQLVRQPLLNL